MMADPASGRCWLFYYPSLTSLLVLLRPVGKPNFNILDPQGPVPRKLFDLAGIRTLAYKLQLTPVLEHEARVLEVHVMLVVFCVPFKSDEEFTTSGGGRVAPVDADHGVEDKVTSFRHPGVLYPRHRIDLGLEAVPLEK